MKEVIVHPLPTLTTEIREVTTPIPAPDEVIVKVIVAGSNVKGIREHHLTRFEAKPDMQKTGFILPLKTSRSIAAMTWQAQSMLWVP